MSNISFVVCNTEVPLDTLSKELVLEEARNIHRSYSVTRLLTPDAVAITYATRQCFIDIYGRRVNRYFIPSVISGTKGRDFIRININAYIRHILSNVVLSTFAIKDLCTCYLLHQHLSSTYVCELLFECENESTLRFRLSVEVLVALDDIFVNNIFMSRDIGDITVVPAYDYTLFEQPIIERFSNNMVNKLDIKTIVNSLGMPN